MPRTQNKSDKSTKAAATGSNVTMFPVEFEKRDIKKSDNYNASISEVSGKVYEKPYDQLMLQMIVRENIYASSCVDIRIKATIGKGWTDDTPDEVKEMFKKDVSERLIYDLNVTGEYYEEVNIKDKKLFTRFHVPSCTMQISEDRKSCWQNYGTATQKEIPLFDEEAYQNGTLKDGKYIIHKMKFMGNPIYGIPFWIGAIDILKIMDNAEKDILDYYDNDAIAKTIMMLYGIMDPENKLGAELKEFLEGNFQGVRKNNKLWIMAGLGAKTQGTQVDFKELNKNIVDGNYLAMIKENKQDICVAFSCPIELHGVMVSGQLGNTQQLKTLLYLFNDNTILPDQYTIMDTAKIFYPENADRIKLKVMEIPDFENPEEIEEAKRKSKEDLFAVFHKLLEMLAEKEET